MSSNRPYRKRLSPMQIDEIFRKGRGIQWDPNVVDALFACRMDVEAIRQKGLGESLILGVREMACRLNGDGKNFDKAAANLARTAQVQLSGETLRVLVETEGKRVLQAQRSGQLPVDWSAADCRHRGGNDADLPRQRWGHGAAGDRRREGDAAAEDQGEAAATRARRRGRCRRGRRVPTSTTRSSRSSPSTTRRRTIGWSAGTRGDHEAAGRLMRREAGRIRFDLADEKVGNVDGSPWIRNQIQRQSLPLDDLGVGLLPPERERAQGAAGDLRRGRRGRQAVGRRRAARASSTTATRRPGSSLLEWRVALRRGHRTAADRLLELRERTAGDDQVSGVPRPRAGRSAAVRRRRPARR